MCQAPCFCLLSARVTGVWCQAWLTIHVGQAGVLGRPHNLTGSPRKGAPPMRQSLCTHFPLGPHCQCFDRLPILHPPLCRARSLAHLLCPVWGPHFAELSMVTYSAVASNGPSQSDLVSSPLEQSSLSEIPNFLMLSLKPPLLLIGPWPLCPSALLAQQHESTFLSV